MKEIIELRKIIKNSDATNKEEMIDKLREVEMYFYIMKKI
jgi:hypothetical protein